MRVLFQIPSLLAARVQSAGVGGRWSPRWLAWLTSLLAFLMLFRGSLAPDPSSLDMSWMLVLAWAFDQQLQWGSDLVFTYGPLGFLSPLASYFPATYTGHAVAQVVLSLTAALIVYGFSRRTQPLINVALMALLVAWYAMLTDDIGYYLTFSLAAVVLHRELEGPARPLRLVLVMAGCALFFGALALTKFTLLLLWLAFLAYAAALLVAHRRVRAAAMTVVAWPCLLLAAWLACGQSPAGLVDHVRGSLELSSGYAGMMLTPPLRVDVVGVLVLLMLVAGLGQFARRARDHHATLLLTLFFGLMAAMAWRAGFVRADSHVLIFFATASFVSIAALAVRPARAFVRAMLGGVVAIGVVVCFLAGVPSRIHALPAAMQALMEPTAHRATQQAAWNAQAAQWDLPRVREAIGDHSLDLLMNQQGIVLINRFNYAPRPVFQGYAAYTPTLARRNERYLLGANAPDYLLADFGAIDDHYPSSDDPLSVLAALRAYEPITAEQGYLLLRRLPDSAVTPIREPDAAQWHDAAIGSDVAVGSGPMVFHHHVELSPLGNLYALLLREPELAIEVTLADHSVVSHRLKRQNGHSGLLLSPYLGAQTDYLLWRSGLGDLDVVRMRLLPRDEWQSVLFADTWRYAMTAVNLPRPSGNPTAQSLSDRLYTGIRPAPAQVHGRSELRHEQGRQVLIGRFSTQVEFKLPPGRWIAAGQFGLLTRSYDPQYCRDGNGIAFVAEKVSSNGDVQTLFRSMFIPARDIGLGNAQPFGYGPVAITDGAVIRLRIVSATGGDAPDSCQRWYLDQVRHKPLADPGVAP